MRRSWSLDDCWDLVEEYETEQDAKADSDDDDEDEVELAHA